MILKSDKGQLQLVFGELMKIIPEMSWKLYLIKIIIICYSCMMSDTMITS